MPTILLVRHGQASFGGPVYDVLSPLGHRQARVTARALAARGLRVDRVVSGSLARQQDTAAPSAAAFGSQAEVDARLNEYAMDDILAAHSETAVRTERLEPGTGPAVSSAQFQDLLDGGLKAWIAAGADGPAAEAWPTFTGRVRAVLTELAGSLPPGGTALAFTSGGVIAAAAMTLWGLPDSAFITFNRVTVNAGLSKLVIGGRGATLVAFNEHGHLDDAGRELITYR